MPPPLNIVMYAFTIVVWCVNLIVSVCTYADIDTLTDYCNKKCNCRCRCVCCKRSWIYIGVVSAIAWIFVIIAARLVYVEVISIKSFWILSAIEIFVRLCIMGACANVKWNIFEHI
eukprot:57128_1